MYSCALLRRAIASAFLALILPSSVVHSQSQDFDHSERRETAAFFAAPLKTLLRLYQGALRQARPAICQMYPSDSSYAVQAIKIHGSAKGILLASDRLQRCGNDVKHYEHVIIEGKPFYNDPVPGAR